MSSKDKRRYPRVQAKNVSAHLNVADQSSPCVIQNISAGGIFIETSEALPVGMPVAVNLARPGWTRVLRVSGRVVWAMAERTAARKGTLPGMRIKFDPLPKGVAEDLMLLLTELGAPITPAPKVVGEESAVGVITQPISIKEIQARVSQTDIPVIREPAIVLDVSPASPTDGSTYRPSVASSPRLLARPSAPRSSQPRFNTPAGPAVSDSPKLIIQVQGLLMQLGELQQQLEVREKELNLLKERLKEKETALDKSDRERKAAELAIQRLAMQLSSRR